MNTRQPITKSNALLAFVAKHGVTPEASIIKDKPLLELFSWHTSRAPKARIKDTLAILVRQGALSQGQIDTEKIYKITSRGQSSLTKAQLRKSITVSSAQQAWNGRWMFVTYQIPESHKIARNQFLIELKRIGFLRYGSALWIYPFDVSVEIKKIAHHLNIDGHIDILRADSISSPALWKRKFHL